LNTNPPRRKSAENDPCSWVLTCHKSIAAGGHNAITSAGPKVRRTTGGILVGTESSFVNGGDGFGLSFDGQLLGCLEAKVDELTAVEPCHRGTQPNPKDVRPLSRRRVRLAVAYGASSGHALELHRSDEPGLTQRILGRE
jgi:hypothetical protein